ncbi:Protein yif1b [Bonamia ostreae]|uniref:Protein YIF1 n=1 Tax=Bonamia ostreae TaxID=126728 RepID=A0ABV2AJQ2_9EUKA
MSIKSIFTDNFSDFGENIAKNQIDQSMEKLQTDFELTNYKSYFAVDNIYVFKKLSILLFPFQNKEWARKLSVNDQGENIYYLPKEDKNAFDLYIPIMAFVTYILLSAIKTGLSGPTFTPEFLLKTTSSSLIAFSIELVLLKIFLHISKSDLSVIDAISMAGYKFVAVNTTILFYLVTGHIGYYLAWVYSTAALVFYMKNAYANGFSENKKGSVGHNSKVAGFGIAELILQSLLILYYGI